jgi:hypothetical protein
VPVAVVDLDADAGDRSTVVVEGDEAGSVERGEPFGEVVGLVLEPHADVGDVG